MASLILLLSELLRHQSPDPAAARPTSQLPPPPSSSSSSFGRPAAAPRSYSRANRVDRNFMGSCRKDQEVVVEDLPEPRFCSDLVWP
ncbi:hypothetical protein RHMOL_Rhmol13G0237600 [Rhododendron molle]|uniref:Uncharacterized protein n=1 Tax=Rhododendron molle TaxID=49168 RepID=A0ACC0LBK9_RHOML|nr:hypothetical protein RHMOL_Rhmol13G0237600 [Rhododendron molle]